MSVSISSLRLLKQVSWRQRFSYFFPFEQLRKKHTHTHSQLQLGITICQTLFAPVKLFIFETNIAAILSFGILNARLKNKKQKTKYVWNFCHKTNLPHFLLLLCNMLLWFQALLFFYSQNSMACFALQNWNGRRSSVNTNK